MTSQPMLRLLAGEINTSTNRHARPNPTWVPRYAGVCSVPWIQHSMQCKKAYLQLRSCRSSYIPHLQKLQSLRSYDPETRRLNRETT